MFVPQGPINIKSVLVHVTVWRRTNRMFNICTRNNEFPDTNMQIETSMSYKLHVYPPLIAPPTQHHNDVIMSATVSQIISLAIVYWTVYSRRRSKKTSKLSVTGLCAENSPVTGPVTCKMFLFDDVIMGATNFAESPVLAQLIWLPLPFFIFFFVKHNFETRTIY